MTTFTPLTMAFTVSSILDNSVAHKIYTEEGERAYVAYHQDTRREPYPAGTLAPVLGTLIQFNELLRFEAFSPVLYTLNHAGVASKIMHSLEEHGLLRTTGVQSPFRDAVYLRGGSEDERIAQLLALRAEFLFTTNAADAENAMRQGIAACIVPRGPAPDGQLGATSLLIDGDLDGVAFDLVREMRFRELLKEHGNLQTTLKIYDQEERALLEKGQMIGLGPFAPLLGIMTHLPDGMASVVENTVRNSWAKGRANETLEETLGMTNLAARSLGSGRVSKRDTMQGGKGVAHLHFDDSGHHIYSTINKGFTGAHVIWPKDTDGLWRPIAYSGTPDALQRVLAIKGSESGFDPDGARARIGARLSPRPRGWGHGGGA